jgi:hypothetical protein
VSLSGSVIGPSLVPVGTSNRGWTVASRLEVAMQHMAQQLGSFAGTLALEVIAILIADFLRGQIKKTKR